MYGYGAVTHALLKAGLVDEVRFWIHPVFQGGPSVTAPLSQARTTLRLADSRVMKSGVIIASYQPVTE
jgi:riboflavin biosynthesis pyrimidine reductase